MYTYMLLVVLVVLFALFALFVLVVLVVLHRFGAGSVLILLLVLMLSGRLQPCVPTTHEHSPCHARTPLVTHSFYMRQNRCY